MSAHLSEQGLKAIQRANQTRNLKCGKCGALSLETVDGNVIGGLPGLTYRYCGGCGWSRPVTAGRRRKGVL